MLKIISKLQAEVIRAKSFIQDTKGATAIEYGLIAVGIALAVVATVGLVGDQLDKAFKDVQKGLKG